MTSRTGTQVTVTVPEDAPPGTVLAVPIKGSPLTLSQGKASSKAYVDLKGHAFSCRFMPQGC